MSSLSLGLRATSLSARRAYIIEGIDEEPPPGEQRGLFEPEPCAFFTEAGYVVVEPAVGESFAAGDTNGRFS